jgi:hypothetical protein
MKQEPAIPNVAVENAQVENRQTGWQIFQSVATRMIIFYFVMQAMNYFKAKPALNTNNNEAGVSMPTELPGNMFAKGTKLVRENKYIGELFVSEKIIRFFLN